MSPLQRPKLAYLVVLLGALASACESSGGFDPVGPPLPFHVVMLPVSLQPGAGRQRESQVSDDVQLHLEREVLAATIQAQLEGRGFVRVSRLEDFLGKGTGGAGSSEAIAGASSSSLKASAARLQADLILRPTLDFDAGVVSRINEKFWLNLPLFLLGGPTCYFIDDRTYEVRARLQAEFYDLTDPHESLEERWELFPIPVQVKIDAADLSFLDRAGADVISYFRSVLVPPGLLAVDGERVEKEIEQAVREGLARELVREIHEGRASFHMNDLAAFHVDDSASRVTRVAPGEAQVDIALVDPDSRGLRSFSISASGKPLLGGALRDPTDGGRVSWIRGRVSLPHGESFIRLRVDDAVGGARSYTFRVVEGE